MVNTSQVCEDLQSRTSERTGRRREKRTILASDTEVDTQFLEMDIRKFCPKKIFDIIVINEVDVMSQDTMINILGCAAKYEDESCVTFIKYFDVIALLDQFDYSLVPGKEGKLIEQILEETKVLLCTFKLDRIPVTKMAILMKIKLIEVMIQHQKKEIEKMKRRKELITELQNLTSVKGVPLFTILPLIIIISQNIIKPFYKNLQKILFPYTQFS